MVELADTWDLKSPDRNIVPVQVRLPAPFSLRKVTSFNITTIIMRDTNKVSLIIILNKKL